MVPRKPRSSRPTRTSHPESQSRSAALSPATASTCLTTPCGPSRAARLERSRLVAPASRAGTSDFLNKRASGSCRTRSRRRARRTRASIAPATSAASTSTGTSRSSAAPPRPRTAAPEARAGRPRPDTARRMAEVWESLFRPQPVSVDDNFFLDLGGHSLLVARMVSELRRAPRFARVSVADVYEHPTIASLASALDAASHHSEPSPAAESPEAPRKESRPGERARHFLCGALQSVGLYFVFGFCAFEWVTPYLVFYMLFADGHSLLESAAWMVASIMATFPALVLAAVAAKWIVLGRVRPGRYPLWGWYYLRWRVLQTPVSVAA